MEMLIPGMLTALGLFILIIKMKPSAKRKLLGFDIYLDIAVTFLLMIMFAGTFAGMMAAIVGGITFSVALWCAKALIGYDKIVIDNSTAHFIPGVRWVSHPGILKTREKHHEHHRNEQATRRSA